MASLLKENPPDRAHIRPGSVGLPVFDTECKVVDLESGEDLYHIVTVCTG